MKLFLGRATSTVAAMSMLLLLLPASEVQAGGGTEKDMPKRFRLMSPEMVLGEVLTNVASQGNNKKLKEEPIADQPMQKGKGDDISEDTKKQLIEEVVGFGWERDEAKEALEINGWDFEDALTYLLDKPLDDKKEEKEEHIKDVAASFWDDVNSDSEEEEVPQEELFKREMIAQFAVLLEEEGFRFNDALLALSQADGNIDRARQYLEEDKNEVRHEVNHGVHHNAGGAPAGFPNRLGVDMTYLKDFIAMGFEEQEIVEALTKCNGNFECAYDRLIR